MPYLLLDMDAQEGVENIIEIETMTDEEVVATWATQNKITQDAVEKLFKEGFNSLQAISLIDTDDLARTKIPRGQQKLILASVGKLNNTANTTGQSEEKTATLTRSRALPNREAMARNNSGAAQTGGQDIIGGDLLSTSQNADSVAPVQPASTDASTVGTSIQSGVDPNDPYIRLLSQQLRLGQSQIQQNSGINRTVESDLNVPGLSFNNHLGHSDITGSWHDPQIYIASASSGKSASSYYEITDFVSNNVEEEIIVGSNGSQQIVVKSGPKKPKLEQISLSQWSVANLAILYKLVEEGKINSANILDYLSYTTKICQLVQRYSLASILHYDKEYRQMQAKHNFRWGTDIPHFQTVHLIPRAPRPATTLGPKQGGTHALKPTNLQSPLTVDGKIICKLYNSRAGCHYKECRYDHSCSYQGCHQHHSAVTHHISKN